MSEKTIDEMSFEEALREFEAIVSKLDGDVALEDSIKLYERGAALKERCETKLKEAEEKIAKITFNADGTPSGVEKIEGM